MTAVAGAGAAPAGLAALHRDVLRRHQRRRGARPRGAVVDRLARRTSCTRSSAAWCRRSPRAATPSWSTRWSPRRCSEAGVGWDDLGRRGHDPGPRPHRRPAGRPGGGQGDRLPRAACRSIPVNHLQGHIAANYAARRGGAVRLPGRQRRAHPAGRGGAAACEFRVAGADHGRRRRRGLRQGRPPARPAATRAAGSSTSWPRTGDAVARALPARRAARPRLQLQRPQDGAAVRPQEPRRGRGRGAPRRHRRLATRRPSSASWSTRRWPAPRPRACARSPSPAAWPPTPACGARSPSACEAARPAAARCRRSRLCTDNAAMIGLAAGFLPAVPWPDYLALDAFASDSEARAARPVKSRRAPPAHGAGAGRGRPSRSPAGSRDPGRCDARPGCDTRTTRRHPQSRSDGDRPPQESRARGRALRRVPRERGRRVRVRHPRRGDARPQRGARRAPRTITFIPVRHEQGAAFMADAYGRLTGKARRLPGHARARAPPTWPPASATPTSTRRPLVALTGQVELAGHAQGDPPVHRHGRDAAADDQVERARPRPAHDRRGGAQGVQRGGRREAGRHAPRAAGRT